MRSRVKIEKDEPQYRTNGTISESNTGTDDSLEGDEGGIGSLVIKERVQSTNTNAPVLIPASDVPSSQITFTSNDCSMMIDTIKLFSVGPRCVRRIINVFKMLLVIWRRDTIGRFKSDDNTKRATLFLMLLASEESTRDATMRIFEWMEEGHVAYHNVAPDKTQPETNLAKVINAELRKKPNKNFERSFNKDKTMKEETFMKQIENELAKYNWEGIDGWERVCSNFLLARSFSFFRLNDEALNEKEVSKAEKLKTLENALQAMLNNQTSENKEAAALITELLKLIDTNST